MIETDTLILRPWQKSDLEPFFEMSNDPVVMGFFPNTLSRSECASMMDRINNHISDHGFGFWALEVPGVSSFVGFAGLSIPGFETAFTPCVEIGWRLAPRFHGFGYATRGAGLCLDYGFGQGALDEIVSFAIRGNHPSIAVMERLGMSRDVDGDFAHSSLPAGHALSQHVLYRITRGQWAEHRNSI